MIAEVKDKSIVDAIDDFIEASRSIDYIYDGEDELPEEVLDEYSLTIRIAVYIEQNFIRKPNKEA